MRLGNTSGGEIISHGIAESSTFKIAANGKAFAVLANMLYQDKIGSIVREISSNAMDSHIAAGTPDKPFEIHIPTHMEPFFSVKDYGVGLSHDDLVNIYCTLFASTKENSNDQVGAFGLGSKTPFSYSDSFSITAIKDGRKRFYTAMLKPSGEPTINLIDDRETDEPNGLEVSMIAKERDYSTFAAKVKEQLRFFKVKPIIVNDPNFEFEDMTSGIFYNLVGIDILSKDAPYAGKTFIVQGGVGYPLEYAELRKYFEKNAAMLAFIKAIEDRGSYVYFDIGQIAVTASREGIQYTEETIQNIAKRFEEARDEFCGRAEKDLDQLPNDFARGVALNEGGVIFRTAIAEKNKYSFQWQGSSYGYVLAEQAVEILPDNPDGSSNAPIHLFEYRKLIRRGSTKISVLENSTLVLYCHRKTRVLIEDVCKNIGGRIRADANKFFHENSGTDQFFVIRPPQEYNADKDKMQNVEVTDAMIKQFSDLLGGIELIRVSSLPEPVREHRSSDGSVTMRKGYRPPTLYKYNGINSMGSRKSYSRIHDKIKDIDGGAYLVIPTGEYDVTVGFDEYAYRKLIEVGLMPIVNVYAVRERDLPKIQASDTWTPLRDIVQKRLDELRANKRLMRKLAYKNAQARLTGGSEFMNMMAQVSNVPAILKWRSRYIERNCNLNEQESWIVDRVYNDRETPEYREWCNKYSEYFQKYVRSLKDKYPLLYGATRAWHSHVDDDAMRDALLLYVQAVG